MNTQTTKQKITAARLKAVKGSGFELIIWTKERPDTEGKQPHIVHLLNEAWEKCGVITPITHGEDVGKFIWAAGRYFSGTSFSKEVEGPGADLPVRVYEKIEIINGRASLSATIAALLDEEIKNQPAKPVYENIFLAAEVLSAESPLAGKARKFRNSFEAHHADKFNAPFAGYVQGWVDHSNEAIRQLNLAGTFLLKKKSAFWWLLGAVGVGIIVGMAWGVPLGAIKFCAKC